ncbi:MULTISPECIES: hypothetical protein [unclassified Pannonibacter]|uniref:hypothetical protein n=1 Tax=unclassified Pannonibacter TaxID=2627228 RepID=UPI00164698B1|nr:MULTISPECIES: hypothetical protein [unclassified Pannonibacter]
MIAATSWNAASPERQKTAPEEVNARGFAKSLALTIFFILHLDKPLKLDSNAIDSDVTNYRINEIHHNRDLADGAGFCRQRVHATPCPNHWL